MKETKRKETEQQNKTVPNYCKERERVFILLNHVCGLLLLLLFRAYNIT